MNQHMRPEPIPFIDIAGQRRRLGTAIDEAVSRVLAHCQFINGPEVTALEAALAAFSGAKHVVSCASGTDALLMVLMAKNVGPGDAVLCPSFTFCATGEAVALTGAVPVFVDVDEATFNMDAASLKRGIATARKHGLKPRAIIPVDLFGLSADYDAISDVARAEGGIHAWQFGWSTFTVPSSMTNVTVRFNHRGFSGVGEHGYVDDIAVTLLREFVPPVPIARSEASLHIGLFAGIQVEGTLGRTYRIEYSATLPGTNWMALTNLSLPSSPYFFLELTSTNKARRFYRAVPIE
jgi:hypothetical protein